MGGRCRGGVEKGRGEKGGVGRWFDLLGSWKRSGKPERSLCEFLLGFWRGEERRWGGDVGGGWCG